MVLFSALSEQCLAQTRQSVPRTNTPPPTVFDETKAKAEAGDIAAQNALGIMYATGNGVRQDIFQASRWFRKAADQGDATAQYHLAFYYYDGERIDYKEAVNWYRLAANQGHASAQNRLGLMYSNGKGVSKDATEALKWFRSAAENGDADAPKNLARIIPARKGNATPQGITLGTPLPHLARRSSIESTNEITTTDGTTYKSVIILKSEPDGLLVEHTLPGGGIGVAKLRFEILSTDLQRAHNYDAEKAAAYQTQQAAAQGQLRREFQAKHEQELAVARAREEENFKARLQIEKLEAQRQQAEAARVRAEAERERIAKEEKAREAARKQAAIRHNQITQEIIEQGYQIRDIWQNQHRSSFQRDRQLDAIQSDVEKIRHVQRWGW